MERMARHVEEYSNGQMTVTIYPAGQLGGERKLLELIQIGAIGMTKVSTATSENIVPAMRVFSLPYHFRDEDHVTQVLYGQLGKPGFLTQPEITAFRQYSKHPRRLQAVRNEENRSVI